MTHSRCKNFEPNNWVEYVDETGTVVHVDRFYDPELERLRPGHKRYPDPPGGYDFGDLV